MSFRAKSKEITIDNELFSLNYDNGSVMDFEDEYGYSITKELEKIAKTEGASMSSNIKLLSVMLRKKGENFCVGKNFVRKLSPIVYEQDLLDEMLTIMFSNMPNSDEMLKMHEDSKKKIMEPKITKKMKK